MTQRKGKILFIGRYAGFDGGVERYEHTVAMLLRRNGYEVCCAYQEKGREFENFSAGFRRMLPLEEVLADSVEYSLVAVHKLSDPALLKKLLEKFREKLVLFMHDHDPYCPRSYYYIPFGRRNCQRAYHPLICGACAMLSNPRSWPNGILGKLKHVLFSFAETLRLYREFPKVVVLSEFMRQNLLRNGFSASGIQLLSPFVESAEQPCSIKVASPPRLLFVGQLIRGKGADLLLRLLPLLRQPYRVDLVGEGKDHALLVALASSLGVADRVEFSGWSPTPEEKMAVADLAVFPFRWQEPFGLVVAECAAAGLPVAAFAQGGVAESLVHGETGLLAAPGDLAELAGHCDRLLGDAALRQQMGQRGREWVRSKFSQEQVLVGYKALLTRIAAASGGE